MRPFVFNTGLTIRWVLPSLSSQVMTSLHPHGQWSHDALLSVDILGVEYFTSAIRREALSSTIVISCHGEALSWMVVICGILHS